MIIAIEDLASYLRDTTVSSDANAQFYVDLANGLVEEVVGTDLTPLPARVMAITLEVAARAWRNPNGYSSETVDDYTYRRDSETRQAGVYLTAAEAAELQTTVTGNVSGMYSVPLGGPDVWVL